MDGIEGSKHLEEAKGSPHDSRYGEKLSYQGDGVGEINRETHRGLNSRHIQFLALGMCSFLDERTGRNFHELTICSWVATGGCIGTGLFVGAGAVLSAVGPGEPTLLESRCVDATRLTKSYII